MTHTPAPTILSGVGGFKGHAPSAADDEEKKVSRSTWIRVSFFIAPSHRVAVICVHSNSGDQGAMSRSGRRVPAPLHFTQRADAGAVFFHTSSNYNKELLEVIENQTEGTRRSEG